MLAVALPLGHALVVLSCGFRDRCRIWLFLAVQILSRPVPQLQIALLQVLELGYDAFVPLCPVTNTLAFENCAVATTQQVCGR